MVHTMWKVSKYGVFSGRYLAKFGLHTKDVPEKNPDLGIFHAVIAKQ